MPSGRSSPSEVLQSLPSHCHCEDSDAWQSFKATHEDHGNAHQLSSREVRAEVMQEVDALTDADSALYKAALERFLKDIEAAERRFSTRILCLADFCLVLCGHGVHPKALQGSNQSLSELKKDLQKCGKRLAEGFSQTAELMSEVPRLARDLQQSLGNEALRRELEAALEAHQECSAQAEDLWHLAEAGCNVGAQQRELELEQSACTQHEEELTRACRRLCDVAGKAGDRSYAAKWSAVEQKLKGLGLRSAWASALEATELLEAEHLCQEKISKQLEQELRRQALLEAELVAPPEAKRALASLRTVTREPQARLLL
ncbi:unnamed protein product [Effrenium voratum]|nr:unnamed protein product [Effrenium voratum]